MRIEWEEDSVISVKAEDGTAVISANRGGLLSLAKQLEALADELPGTHVHYDSYNSLEEGSVELIVEKTE